MKVLIVEDHGPSLMTLTRIVKSGWQIDTIPLEIVGVTTLTDALREADTANVTILDLDLPDSDTENTIRQIGKFRPPVIVLTGDASAEVAASCRKHGADHVFVKGESLGLVTAIFELMQKDILEKARERGSKHASP